MRTPPPGADWYPDSSGKPGRMYWDGQQWYSDSTADAPLSGDQLTSQPPLLRRHTTLIAALAVTLTVLLAIVGVSAYLLVQRRHTTQTETAQRQSPPSQSAQTAPPSMTAAPSTSSARHSAQMPGLAPLLGQWNGGQSGRIDIHPDGTGRWTYSDTSACPNAPLAGCGISGTADFTLTSVANGTAAGSVTASSNPMNVPVGEPVTIVVGSGLQGEGVVLAVSISKMQGWNFCNDTSPHYCAGS